MTSLRHRKIEFDPPYDKLLQDVLAFKTLEETEDTILHLEELRQRFRVSSDKKGMEYCRRIGALGRQRAELIARNKRVDPKKRLQKKEVALWFQIWLETPELFGDWLCLRKNTTEFRNLRGLEINP